MRKLKEDANGKLLADDPIRRKEIATKIEDMLSAAEMQKGSLKQRWDRNEAFYRNEPPGVPSKAFPDAEQFHVPLVQPKVSALTASVCGTITGADPFLIAKSRGTNADRMEPLENDIHYLLEAARFDLQLRSLATVAANCGVGISRVSFAVQVQGMGAQHDEVAMTLEESENPLADEFGAIRFAGVVIDVIHPADFTIFPASVGLITGAKMVGHRFFRRVQEVEEFQEAGRYFSDVPIHGGDSPETYQAGMNTQYSLSNQSTNIADPKDDLLEMWSLVVRLDLDEDGNEEYYEVTLAKNTTELLEIRAYALSRPWYFDHRFHAEYGGFWPAGSIAQNLQGLQLVYNELHNLAIDGAYISAFPPIFTDGNPLIANAAERYSPGDLIPTEGGITPFSPTARFNGEWILPVIQQIERVADQTARISQNRGGAQMRGNITATEVSQIAAADSAGINEYVANFGIGVVQMAMFVAELYRGNFLMLKALHLDALQLDQPPPSTVRYELNGKSPVNTAAARIMNAQTLMQFAPNPETGLDVYELTKALVDAMQLTNSDKIQFPKEQVQQMMMAAQQEAQMQDQQASLAMQAGGALG